MKTIVITGSTRGIGYGLADSFLARGCSVTISGRTETAVVQAVTQLSSEYESQRVYGHPCDVTQFEQVQSLWDAAQARFGQTDIWINNAGIGHAQMHLWEHSPEQTKAVIETNLVGSMYGSQVALKGMLAQGFGSLYNMEGLGSDGRRVEGLTLYGSTKHALRYLNDALVKETKETPVLVGALQPGMVVTDLLIRQYQDRPEEWEQAKRVFNLLADHVETVTPWFVDKVLGNDRAGVRFQWLSRGKVIGRFLTAPFGKRDLFGGK